MRLKPILHYLTIALLLTLLLLGCQSTDETTTSGETAVSTEATEAVAQAPTAIPTDTPAPTNTPIPPTDTPAPTDTPEPTETPAPTDTPEPTNTPAPTNTPSPTDTPEPKKPTLTPTPDKSSETNTNNDNTNTTTTPTNSEDPLTLIAASQEALQKVDSYAVNFVLEMGSEGVSLGEIRLQCLLDVANENIYCLFEDPAIPEDNLEILLLNGESWIREGVDEWQREEDTGETFEDVINDLSIFVGFDQFVSEAKLIGETTVEGEPIQEISFSFDYFAYLAGISGESVGEALGAQGTPIFEEENTIAINTANSLPSQVNINGSTTIDGVNLTVTVQISYSDFNETLDFPDPSTG